MPSLVPSLHWAMRVWAQWVLSMAVERIRPFVQADKALSCIGLRRHHPPRDCKAPNLCRVINPLRVDHLWFKGCRASPGITSTRLQWVCWNVCRGVGPQICPVPRLLRLQCPAFRPIQHIKAVAEHSTGPAVRHAPQSTPAIYAGALKHVPHAPLLWNFYGHSSMHNAAFC